MTALAPVEARLAALLDAFAPSEILERRRAEDLVASTLTVYGAALRRAREVVRQHGSIHRVVAWETVEPLASLLALHGDAGPAREQLADEDVRAAAAAVEQITDELDRGPAPVRDRTLAMLDVVVQVHGEALAQLIRFTGAAPAAGRRAVDALVGDDLVASVLLVHGLHPSSAADRLRAVVDELDRRAGAVADVSVLRCDGDGATLRVSGATPGDAYRLRLLVERTIAERVPDLRSLVIEGGDEPKPPVTVTIPVESLTIRSSGSGARP